MILDHLGNRVEVDRTAVSYRYVTLLRKLGFDIIILPASWIGGSRGGEKYEGPDSGSYLEYPRRMQVCMEVINAAFHSQG